MAEADAEAGARANAKRVRWRNVTQTDPVRRALVVWSRHTWVSPELDVADGDVLRPHPAAARCESLPWRGVVGALPDPEGSRTA